MKRGELNQNLNCQTQEDKSPQIDNLAKGEKSMGNTAILKRREGYDWINNQSWMRLIDVRTS